MQDWYHVLFWRYSFKLMPGASKHYWTPAAGLSIQNYCKSKVFVTTTTYFIGNWNWANGCFKSDRITVTLNPIAVIDAGNDLAVLLRRYCNFGVVLQVLLERNIQWTTINSHWNFDTVQNPICSPLNNYDVLFRSGRWNVVLREIQYL